MTDTGFFTETLDSRDPEIFGAIRKELGRQRDEIELIASENIVSKAVLEAQGSVLTNKYAEGYPGKRYYGGCQYVDIAEKLAIQRACELFDCKFANVQPSSGSQANQAVFLALLQPGDSFLGLDLADRPVIDDHPRRAIAQRLDMLAVHRLDHSVELMRGLVRRAAAFGDVAGDAPRPADIRRGLHEHRQIGERADLVMAEIVDAFHDQHPPRFDPHRLVRAVVDGEIVMRTVEALARPRRP